MTITVVQYKCSNPASIPLKQYNGVRYTTVVSGMPEKFGYADGGSTFATGRKVYIDAPQCSSIINGTTPYSSIRVDSNNLTTTGIPECIKVIDNKGWSNTKITIPGQRRNALYETRTRCCQNGKMTVVSSSDEYIERKKNRAIGRGISSSSGFLTFADNNLQGNHTNLLTVANARRRCRNSGYVVPAKCRGNSCGQTKGWPVTPLLGR